MTIAPAIIEKYPALSDAQSAIVGHIDGPLLVVAGPGAGKTESVVIRAMNLLLLGKATPRQLVVCTYTDKAAFELRDRISSAARKLGYLANLSELRVSTIHGLCNRLLLDNRHRTRLGPGYETLDELTQRLFVFENFAEIVGDLELGGYLGRWATRWTAIDGILKFIDKITEERVDPAQLIASSDTFLSALGRAYQAYETALYESNRVDFGHLQSIVLDLMLDGTQPDAIAGDVHYVLVDEYQDTNYIQEQLLLKMTETTRNLCVVGDEDQSLYRFRGATVRNILEFPARFPGCKLIRLTTNYRSHRGIVESYDRWMGSADWLNKKGTSFRFDKTILPDPNAVHPDYSSVISIWGQSELDEAVRFADLVEFLKSNGVIEDYSQVALLLYSVREKYSGHYIEALDKRGIRVFCPRARGYFEVEEIQLLVACFAIIFGWTEAVRGEVKGAVADLAAYVDEGIIRLAQKYVAPHALGKSIQTWVAEIAALQEGEALDLRPADYLYRLLAHPPFADAAKNENVARNLAIFSRLLGIFQNYYKISVVTYKNRQYLRANLFNSFLRDLHSGGINLYEDPDQPFPKGHVQVMTIHQAKGLEFPVVVVGSLTHAPSTQKEVDRLLGPYYHRAAFEPENRVTEFDRMRLHYVAFSRAQHILVLTAHALPKPYFAAIWQDLPQWPYVEKNLLGSLRFKLKERMAVKRSFSFTGDLKIYETCPRQYQFFREYEFTPSRSGVIFFGSLVHQTIEELHRTVLDGRLHTLSEGRIRELFDRTFGFLSLGDVRPIGPPARETAFQQVLNYFQQNQEGIKQVVQTEVDVSLEKDNYILTGKVDLLLGRDGTLQLLDFKTSPRPSDNSALAAAYERQLCTYAHILEHRHGKRVDKMMLYWTSEKSRQRALMSFPYVPERIQEAGDHFESVVRQIQAQQFQVVQAPEAAICRECDLRKLCRSDGTISFKE